MEAEQAAAMAAIDQDSDPTQAYCGINTIWNLPADHPFNPACEWHDTQYDLARAGVIKAPNSDVVDAEFLVKCLAIAGDNPVLKAEAYLFHALCQTWGRYRWPEAAKQ